MTVPLDPLREALAAHQAGDFAQAEAGYRERLRANPADPKAHYFLGLLHFHRGDHSAAIESVSQALRLAPSNAQAWNSLGGMLIAAGRARDAKEAYRRAVSVSPESSEGWYNLGICLRDDGEIAPAIEALRAALHRDPAFHRAYGALSALLYQAGQTQEASELYIQWAARDPSNAYARHMAAASSGQDAPERASVEFVRSHFDDFAERFDASLARLEYQAPAWVAKALALNLDEDSRVDVLDAGCGTGLCGPLVREYCRNLVGVDLSDSMLARARVRGVYDELVNAELCDFMRARARGFDAILSADTLCYFGSLSEPLRAAKIALHSGGILVVTLEVLSVESAQSDARQNLDASAIREPTYHLAPHGRYAHSEGYVRSALVEAGFELISLSRDVVRREGTQEVSGWLVVARGLQT